LPERKESTHEWGKKKKKMERGKARERVGKENPKETSARLVCPYIARKQGKKMLEGETLVRQEREMFIFEKKMLGAWGNWKRLVCRAAGVAAKKKDREKDCEKKASGKKVGVQKGKRYQGNFPLCRLPGGEREGKSKTRMKKNREGLVGKESLKGGDTGREEI